ncbi:MAG: glutamine synthetase [Candidatus Eremiobacteraeota bacterium]|nr:glutamine synthetase [Candidatus Eremiobacteraeota bacterium]
MHSTLTNGKAINKRDVLRLAKERDVRFVRLSFVDILGINKSVSIPVAELERAIEGRVTFDGGSIDGFVRGEEADMRLLPDLATFAVYPWTNGGHNEARLICNIATADGEPFEGCPRTTLMRAIDDAADVATGLQSGLEVEFYLFDVGPGGAPTTASNDVGSYFDINESDRGELARTEIVTALEAMGLGGASSHHEHGAGQHEIDLRETGLLAASDALITLRTVAKHVAARHGLHATFMPKPAEHLAGSGVHVYFAFPRDAAEGEDVEDDDLGENALFAIGGLLEHAPAFTAICNPTVNSYKRLVAAWDAPIYTVWSHRSANSLVRVPSPEDARSRIEVRSADPSCNPYLAMSVLLASAAHGIRSHALPGDPLTGSTYELNDRERDRRRIKTLPKSLRQALVELEKDVVVRAALGDHIYLAFRDAKVAEYERYRRAVHPWEREAYLRVY